MAQATNNSETRRQILRAALKHFANGGYAATSVQQIVGTAKVSKPALYYHFRDKAALFEALVNEAHDGRFRVVQEAVTRAQDFPGQLREVLVALFDYFHKNRELTRIAFSTAYAAPGECRRVCAISTNANATWTLSTRSSSARRRRASWTIVLTVGNSPTVFTGRRIFTSRRIC